MSGCYRIFPVLRVCACTSHGCSPVGSNTKHYGLLTEKISIGWMRRFTAVFKDCIGCPIPYNNGKSTRPNVKSYSGADKRGPWADRPSPGGR